MDVKTTVARTRFPFPNEEKPAWRTYINDGDNPIAALPTADGDVFPDILVIDRASTTNKYIMAASVCLGGPSVEDLTVWKRIAPEVDSFYVFVPEDQCRHAVELAATVNLEVSGFRYFRRDGGSIKINDCF